MKSCMLARRTVVPPLHKSTANAAVSIKGHTLFFTLTSMTKKLYIVETQQVVTQTWEYEFETDL